jgi:hypothetical protein
MPMHHIELHHDDSSFYVDLDRDIFLNLVQSAGPSPEIKATIASAFMCYSNRKVVINVMENSTEDSRMTEKDLEEFTANLQEVLSPYFKVVDDVLVGVACHTLTQVRVPNLPSDEYTLVRHAVVSGNTGKEADALLCVDETYAKNRSHPLSLGYTLRFQGRELLRLDIRAYTTISRMLPNAVTQEKPVLIFEGRTSSLKAESLDDFDTIFAHHEVIRAAIAHSKEHMEKLMSLGQNYSTFASFTRMLFRAREDYIFDYRAAKGV